MRYIWQHIKTIIAKYDGSTPLAHYLKSYFRQHPILGSRDRRTLSAMAYTWYRCAKGFRQPDLLFGLMEEWQNDGTLLSSSPAQLLLQNEHFDIDGLFPFDIAFSEGITRQEWVGSILNQPKLFIRVIKDKHKIISKLNENNISFDIIPTVDGIDCFSLPNGAKIDAILPPDSYVVQDASSQKTGAYFRPGKNEKWYDCCSGAGGKSLLLKSLEPSVLLTVSDVRESILHNLKQRFLQYHYTLPGALVLDVSKNDEASKLLNNKQFEAIICDVPCSGSGTWARTPEQLYFFDPKVLGEFSARQEKIAANVANYLAPGGRLIYITCSIFKQENEMVVEKLVNGTGFQQEEEALINGISIGADSMFIAILKKPS